MTANASRVIRRPFDKGVAHLTLANLMADCASLSTRNEAKWLSRQLTKLGTQVAKWADQLPEIAVPVRGEMAVWSDE